MCWKRIAQSALCLLVVFAILLNMVPVKADATAIAGAAVAGVVAVDAIKVITAILIGLGVTWGASRVDWDDLRRGILEDLKDFQLTFDDERIEVALVDLANAGGFFAVSQVIIDRVRSYLHANNIFEIQTVDSSYGFSVSHLGSYIYSFYHALLPFWKSSSSSFVSCLSSLGVNNNVMVLGCNNSHVVGLFFDSSGLLCFARFDNKLGVANASCLGVFPLSDLGTPSGVKNVTANYFCPVYYSKYYAEKMSGFLTSSAVAFDFTGIPASPISFRFFTKASSSSTWDSGLSILDLDTFDYTSSFCFAESPICWVGGTTTSISTSLDLTLENVSDPEKDLASGYVDWSAGAITVPGADVGSEEDRVNLWPLGLGNSLTDTESLTQKDVWTGSNVSNNTTSGTVSDSIANVGASTFWDTLTSSIASVFVPSADYLTSKVDSLASNFPFITPIVTLARTISSDLSGEDTGPPVIYLDLTKAQSENYKYGEKVAFIDMTWYEDYKPLGDALLSSLLWVVFVWRLFRQLPGIISGMPGDFNAAILDKLHVELPSRSMDNDITRAENREAIRKRFEALHPKEKKGRSK